MKIVERVAGTPIIVGGRTLIPVVEYSTFSRSVSVGKKGEELVVSGITVTPVSVKVFEGEEEWVLHIQQQAP